MRIQLKALKDSQCSADLQVSCSSHIYEKLNIMTVCGGVKTQAKLKSKGANNLWPFLPVWFQSSSCTQCKRKQGTGPALVWWKKTLNYDKGWHDFAWTLCAARLIYPGSSGNSCVSGWCWGSGHQTEPSCSSWSSPGQRLTFFSCWRSAQDQQHVSNA